MGKKVDYEKSVENLMSDSAKTKEEHAESMNSLRQELEHVSCAYEEKCRSLKDLENTIIENEKQHDLKIEQMKVEMEKQNNIVVEEQAHSYNEETNKLLQDNERLTTELNNVSTTLAEKSKSLKDLQDELAAKEQMSCQEIEKLNGQLSQAEETIMEKNVHLTNLQSELTLKKEDYEKSVENLMSNSEKTKEEHAESMNSLRQELEHF